MMNENKNNIPEGELPDEALDEAAGGIQAGLIVSDSYSDEFGNHYVRDENGFFQRSDQMDQHPKRTPYL